MFGLPVTDYPSLDRTRKELNLLQKLYGLYNSVMLSIDGYFEILWVEVDIEKINQELLDFSNRYVYILYIQAPVTVPPLLTDPQIIEILL